MEPKEEDGWIDIDHELTFWNEMYGNWFVGERLCRIIEAGARFNLKSLKMGAVELEFAERGRLAIEDLPKTYQYDLPSPESAGAPNETKQEPKA